MSNAQKGNRNRLGQKNSNDHNNRISETRKQRHIVHDKETMDVIKQKLHKYYSQNDHTMKAKTYADIFGEDRATEIRIRLSESHKEQMPVNAKTVVCIETGKVFKSMLSVFREENISKKTLRKYINSGIEINGKRYYYA
jgi:hypothetical protein